MSQVDPPRRLLLALIAERHTDLKTVSLQIKRNHAYLQQYVKSNKPAELPENAREKLGELFGVDADCFRSKPKLRKAKNTPADGDDAQEGNVQIMEPDVRPQAGSGSLPDFTEGDSTHPVVDQWSIPKRFIESYLPDTGQLTVLPVLGNSMEPDFLAGERVLVDTSHKSPSPDGVYVLWDGLGLVIKQVQLIPKSDPARLRLISVNKTYDTYEVLASEAEISGRVVGKWVWK